MHLGHPIMQREQVCPARTASGLTWPARAGSLLRSGSGSRRLSQDEPMGGGTAYRGRFAEQGHWRACDGCRSRPRRYLYSLSFRLSPRHRSAQPGLTAGPADPRVDDSAPERHGLRSGSGGTLLADDDHAVSGDSADTCAVSAGQEFRSRDRHAAPCTLMPGVGGLRRARPGTRGGDAGG
jgi:hypothetical protein